MPLIRCSYPTCPHADWPSPWEREQPRTDLMIPYANAHHCTRAHTPKRSLDFAYQCSPPIVRAPSSHHALAIMTAKRDVPTLGTTLRALTNAGSADWPGPKFLSSDGLCDTDRMDWSLHETASPQGSAKTFINTLRCALSLDPDLDCLTILEDDVSTCINALPYVATTEVPSDVAFVTWFTYDYDFSSPPHPKLAPLPKTSPNLASLACRSSRYFILTQACTFPRRTVERILDCPRASQDWHKHHAHDELISWALGDSLYAAHFPILFQHRGGENSAVTFAALRGMQDSGNAQDGARTSPHYVGDAFDAFSLRVKKHEP